MIQEINPPKSSNKFRMKNRGKKKKNMCLKTQRKKERKEKKKEGRLEAAAASGRIHGAQQHEGWLFLISSSSIYIYI